MFLTIKWFTYSKMNYFEKEQIICIRMDLALNILQRLIRHKSQVTCQKQKIRQQSNNKKIRNKKKKRNKNQKCKDISGTN